MDLNLYETKSIAEGELRVYEYRGRTVSVIRSSEGTWSFRAALLRSPITLVGQFYDVESESTWLRIARTAYAFYYG